MAFSLLSVGARAMSANYAALQTTSNNIANANVAGYSRQQANLQTTAGQASGSGFLGSGVKVGSITRAHDAFVTREAATANSQASFDSTHVELLSQLESSFATGDEGVGAAASNFFTALADLANTPGDTSARQAVLSRAGELAQRFSSAGQNLDKLQAGVVTDLRSSVDSINGLTGSLAQLNDEIVRQQGLGQPPNELLDQRDQLVHQLSGFLQVTTVASPNGALSVFAAGGQRLVLGGEAQKLEVVADDPDNSRAAVALREADGSVRKLDSGLLESGGSVGAMLRFQNDDLVAARNTLGQMAMAMAARTNLQQARGLDLGNPPGAGEPIFTDFIAQSLAGGLKALPAQGNALTDVQIHIGDASLLEAEEYSLEVQSDGSLLMARASDGKRFSSVDGGATFTVVNPAAGEDPDFHPGFTLQLGGAPAPGDRFLLQPVGQAASGIERVLADPKGIAAASQLTATASAGNTGTATMSSLVLTNSGFGSDTVQGSLKFTGANADGSLNWTYDWTQTDVNGVATSGTLTGPPWQKNQPLALPGFELTLGGTPALNDSFSVGTTTHPGSNNGNAKALAALSREAIVGRDWKASGNTGGLSLNNAYASALSSVGTRVQAAETASDISTGVALQTAARRDAQSGVDTDEEGAKLIAYQKSYQAAAKVLQVAQSIFDTLLEATSGR
jgi:flagellar hook-associated protein 1 FlgK